MAIGREKWFIKISTYSRACHSLSMKLLSAQSLALRILGKSYIALVFLNLNENGLSFIALMEWCTSLHNFQFLNVMLSSGFIYFSDLSSGLEW